MPIAHAPREGECADASWWPACACAVGLARVCGARQQFWQLCSHCPCEFRPAAQSVTEDRNEQRLWLGGSGTGLRGVFPNQCAISTEQMQSFVMAMSYNRYEEGECLNKCARAVVINASEPGAGKGWETLL